VAALRAAQNALADRSLRTLDLHNRTSAHFPSRLLFNEALPWSLTKQQIMNLFYLARLKAIKHPLDKTCLSLLIFSL